MPRAPKTHAQRERERTGDSRSRREYDRGRGSAASRGYDATWRRLRAWFLARNPLCIECHAHGRTTAAKHVDHVVAIAEGGGRLDPDNLQALCAACHSRKTATHDGAFGNRRQQSGDAATPHRTPGGEGQSSSHGSVRPSREPCRFLHEFRDGGSE